MEKAKAAVSDFLGRSGHHDTSTHETVAPAVQHETIKPHQHENVTKAVDKEIHQEHHHRTVQPIQHREVLPEKHTTKLGEVQHREFDRRDQASTQKHLAQTQAQFKDQKLVESTSTSQNVAPTVGGEHVHHHIYETIQPVVHKETVQPNVVHTTVPIHEVHHNKALHHDTTTLPPMTMDQFKAKSGTLQGGVQRHDQFEGPPRNSDGTATGFDQVHGQHQHHHQHHNAGAGLGSTSTGGLTGSSTKGGLTGDRGQIGQGNLTGSSTQGGVVSSGDRHHNNNLTSNQSDNTTSSARGDGLGRATGAAGAVDGARGSTKDGLVDRNNTNKDGTLPKALVEDRSKAVPHPGTQ